MFFVGMAAVSSIMLFATVVMLAPEWIGAPPPPPISESYDDSEYQENRFGGRPSKHYNTDYRAYNGPNVYVMRENERRDKRDLRFNTELKIIEACTSRKDFACAEEHYKNAFNFTGTYAHNEQLNAAYARMSSEKAKLKNSASEANTGVGFKVLSALIQAAGKLGDESNQNLQQRTASAPVQQRPSNATVQQVPPPTTDAGELGWTPITGRYIGPPAAPCMANGAPSSGVCEK